MWRSARDEKGPPRRNVPVISGARQIDVAPRMQHERGSKARPACRRVWIGWSVRGGWRKALDEQVQQRRQAQALGGKSRRTRMLAEGLGDEALSRPGRPGDEDGLVGGDPAVLSELEELLLAKPPGGTVIEALDRAGAVFELRDAQARATWRSTSRQSLQATCLLIP